MTRFDDIPSSDPIMISDLMGDGTPDITEVNTLGEVTADSTLLGGVDAFDLTGGDPFAFRLDDWGRIESGGGDGSGGGAGGGGGGGYSMNYAPTLSDLGATDYSPSTTNYGGPAEAIGSWTAEQVGNARTIAKVGRELGASDRDIQIALMAAIVESGLKNVNYGDRDSLGLFQQRDAWGSAQDRTTPAKAAEMFFTGGNAGQRGLLDFADRKEMGLGQAAQAVQVSAFPDRYAEHQSDAQELLGNIGNGAATAHGWRKRVIESAREMLGVPYVWGGTSYSGVDCSGLVQLMYKKVGIDLPRISAAQAASGPRIGLDELEPGDLVGWDNSSRNNGADHIAIYIGDGQIIEAPHPGAVVQISPLYDTSRAWGVSMAEYDPFQLRGPRSSRSDGRSNNGGQTSLDAYGNPVGTGVHRPGRGGTHTSVGGGGGSTYHPTTHAPSGGHSAGDPTSAPYTNGGGGKPPPPKPHKPPKPKPPPSSGGHPVDGPI